MYSEIFNMIDEMLSSSRSHARQKSAFATHCGLHEFVPATFQRLMEVVLAGMVWQCCFVYIDILLSSSTFEEHLGHLNEVFERLRQANLKVTGQSSHK